MCALIALCSVYCVMSTKQSHHFADRSASSR